MTTPEILARYHARRWKTVPVHRPDPDTGRCSCGREDCPKPGKHPDARYWPGDAADPAAFVGRNVGVRLGPDSADLADVDLDCPEAVACGPALLPPTGCAFGRGGRVTHHLYTVADRAAAFAKLLDPVLTGGAATIVELRWPDWDPEAGRTKAVQTVFPPSWHASGDPVVWVRDGDPAGVAGADLAAAVRHVGAAVLIARYARPKERHQLVLLLANLLVRAGWADDARAVGFVAAVFAARNDADKEAKVRNGEGLGAVADARQRVRAGKPMTGLPALKDMLDPALSDKDGTAVVARVKDWLGVPDSPGPKVTWGTTGAPTAAPRYTPLPPWRPFPVEHLPVVVRAFTAAVATTMRCDPTYVCLPALAACAGMIGNTRVLALKKSWTEPAMLWTATVGESGTLKTPPYKAAIAPVVAMQKRHFQAYKEAARRYAADLRAYDRDKRRSKDEDPGDPPAPPVCTRVYARDVTVEALAGILNENRTRLLIGRDELNGWLSSFNQYKAKGGSDQANWLELHHRGTLDVSRKTGDTKHIFIEGVGVSVCGGIQPGVLRAALSPQQFSAGLPARLLFAYPPRQPKQWTEDDVDPDVEAGYARLLTALASLEPHTDDDGEPYPVTLRLAPDAKAAWVAFYDRFGARQAETEGDTAAAFSKLEGYAARLSLVHHVCQSVAAGEAGLDPVPLASVTAGIGMAEWFCHEAERIYQMLGEQTEETETRKLVETVVRLAARHGGRITAKHLQEANRKKYRSADLAVLALDRLAELGLGRWEDRPAGPHGGRPTRDFVVEDTKHETHETPVDDGPDGGEPPAGGPDNDLGSGVTIPPNRPWGPKPAGSASPESHDGSDGSPGPNPGVSWVSCFAKSESGNGDIPPPRPPSALEVSGEDSCHPTYTLVTSPEWIGTVVAAVEDGGPVGLDVETTGLDPARDRVRLVQLATNQGTFLIDLFEFPDPAAALAPLLAALSAVEVLGHNLQFELRFLARLGFVPGRVYDTLLASQVLHAGARSATGARLQHNLGAVVSRELGRDLDKTQQTSDWSRPLLSAEQLAYAAADAAVLLPLAAHLQAQLETHRLTATASVEMRALLGVAWARPVHVDVAGWTRLADEVEAELEAATAKLNQLAPNPGVLFGGWKWTSPKDVRAAFRSVGVDLTSTNARAVAGVGHPLGPVFRQYKQAETRSKSYGKAWLADHVRDGRVMASWRQIGQDDRTVDTGRMSCTDPNLQQIPRASAYRRCLVAGPGKVLIKADYSQIELRIAARLSGDGVMAAAYRDGGDLHTRTARALLGTDVVSKADRQLAKAVNFGLLYGQGARGLAAYARQGYGVSLTEAEADAHRNTFFATYPGLRRWQDGVRGAVKARFRRDPAGSHETRTVGGRRRILAVAKRRADGGAYPNVTDALNAPVQGTGADGLKAAIGLLWERRAECPTAVPVLFCHDEIVVEVPEGEAAAATDWVERCMADGMRPLIDPIPVVVEVTVGRTWGG